MDIQKEREAFDNWYGKKPKGWLEGVKYNTAWKAWQAAKEVPECTWKQNEDGVYDTSCTNYFVFPEPEDGPSDHDFTHCCFCGGQLIEAQHPSSTSDCPDEP